MARSAPTIASATPTVMQLSLRWMDASGDTRADSHNIALADATDAKVEAYVAAVAAISNAVLYEVQKTFVWGDVPDKDDAVNAPKDSASDNLVVQLKNPTRQSVRGYIPAPDDAILVAGTDQIDPTNADLATYLTALLGLYAAGSYSVVGARYNERRETNEQVKI